MPGCGTIGPDPTEDETVSAAEVRHDDEEQGARMAKAVATGAAVAVPISYVLVVVALRLITGGSLAHALETAFLPSVLIGVFFGGFWGMTKTSL